MARSLKASRGFVLKMNPVKRLIVPGTDLVTRLSELKQRPRLVVLASCQSAGSGADAQTTDDGGSRRSAAFGASGNSRRHRDAGKCNDANCRTFHADFLSRIASRRSNRSRRGSFGGTCAGADWHDWRCRWSSLFEEGTHPLQMPGFTARKARISSVAFRS